MVCLHVFCAFVFLVTLNDPDDETVLIEGVLFRAKYLGSTQLISEGHPSKAMRMMQAQEAVGRIKVLIRMMNMETMLVSLLPNHVEIKATSILQ